MKLLKTIALLCTVALPTSLAASPYCAALGDLDQLPKKYAKRGPLHADAASGWIVGQDQLKTSFEVTPEVTALWQAIRAKFEERGARLVVLAPPPRPLFAPKTVLPTGYDQDAARQGFTGYIAGLNDAGIAAPDLSTLADGAAAREFYFARDTHWTPKGAALSAQLLARIVGKTSAPVSFDAVYAEKGSLSAVVEKTCGARPEAEVVPSPNYAKDGDASALLGGSAAATIALVGTSFSDRYQTDSYQVAGALAHAFGAEVENVSVTGGGMVGAMAAFIRNGGLARGQFETIVWETPYTSPLTNVSGLRQILGALQEGEAVTNIYSGPLDKEWLMVKQDISLADANSIAIETPGISQGKMSVELFDPHGDKVRVKLVKSDRIKPDQRSETWSLSLADLPLSQIARVKIKLDQVAKIATVTLIN